METVTIPFAIIGIINAIQKQFPQVTGILAIGLAIVLGVASSFVPVDHPAVQGALVALASSGVFKIGQVIGQK